MNGVGTTATDVSDPMLARPAVGDRGNLRRVFAAVRSPSTMLSLVRARIALRACTSVAWTVRLRGRVNVHNHHRIEIGDRVRIDGGTVPVELVSWSGPLTVGARTFINYGCSISAHAGVRIGEDCLIGNYVMIMDNDYHDVADRTQPGESKPIVVGDGAWLGARAIVLKGVTIGDGAVIGAGAVVTKDVPPRVLAAGVPARVVRAL